MILIVIREENSITILSRSSSTLLIMLANSFSESAIMEKKTVFNKTAANLKQMHHTFGTKLYITEFTFLKKDY